jgi:hypothetical protein
MLIPTATFDDAETVVGRQSIIQITPTGGSAANLLVDFVSHDPGLELADYQAPGASNGPAYTPRSWEKSRKEVMKFRTKQIGKVISLLGSLSAKKTGTCLALIRDPADETGKVRLSTDAFACTVCRDPGEASFSPDSPTEITLVVASNKDGPITFTKNADFSS